VKAPEGRGPLIGGYRQPVQDRPGLGYEAKAWSMQEGEQLQRFSLDSMTFDKITETVKPSVAVTPMYQNLGTKEEKRA
jgi:hypothetical protein